MLSLVLEERPESGNTIKIDHIYVYKREDAHINDDFYIDDVYIGRGGSGDNIPVSDPEGIINRHTWY